MVMRLMVCVVMVLVSAYPAAGQSRKGVMTRQAAKLYQHTSGTTTTCEALRAGAPFTEWPAFSFFELVQSTDDLVAVMHRKKYLPGVFCKDDVMVTLDDASAAEARLAKMHDLPDAVRMRLVARLLSPGDPEAFVLHACGHAKVTETLGPTSTTRQYVCPEQAVTVTDGIVQTVTHVGRVRQ